MVTVGDYLSNPYGKGTAAFSTSHMRDTVNQELAHDYPEPITYQIYSTKRDDITIHCKMPSRTKRGVHYDVVFQINISMKADNTRQGIGKYPFKCFSNSPSFYYTFARAFRDQDMICDWLWKKYDRKVRWHDPITRNPQKIVGYERTVYTCLWKVYQDLRGRNVRDIYNKAIVKGYRDIAKEVLGADAVKGYYDEASFTDAVMQQKAEAAQRRADREAKKKAEKEQQPKSANASKSSPKTAKTKTTAKSSRTTSSSRSKSVQKVGRSR